MCISKGAELASATVPWHWLFFCLASKLYYENYDILNYISKKLRGLEVALVDFSSDRRPCALGILFFVKSQHSYNFMWPLFLLRFDKKLF